MRPHALLAKMRKNAPLSDPKANLRKGFGGASVLLLILGVQASPPQAKNQPAATINPELFETKIRPALEARCIACHGPKQQIANLRLDKPISAKMAQKVAEAIAYTGDTLMPPSGKLPKAELAVLLAWTKGGAQWPVIDPNKTKAKGTFWAFVPPKVSELPPVKAKWWAQNPLDHYVLAKLEERGLKPSPVADRRTLIRRATFDLTGLPPTPEEIDAFLADTKPNAFERVLDRLLATPAYGERWGRHWLDVARYADSNGLDENLVYANAWRYRDWVINAMNADKPIDRFIHEQIAGDLLPGAGDNEVVATGFLALGAKMLAEDDPVKQEMDIIDEQVDTVSKSILGITVGCARCHDHKFDPISAKDYYSLAGIFKSTKTMQTFTVVADWNERAIGSKENQAKAKKIEGEVKAKSEIAAKKRKTETDALRTKLKDQLPEYEKAARSYLTSLATREKLRPVVTSADGSLPNGSISFEAEDFKSGNVLRDLNGYGKGIGVIQNGGQYPNRAEYEVVVPSVGPYQVDLRYAAGDARPIRLYINGILATSNAANMVSGGFYPQNQQWFVEGIYQFQAGVNTIKFERESYFPHVDKVLLTKREGQPLSESLHTLASRNGLIPEVVGLLAEKLKSGGEAKIELPEKADALFPMPLQEELKQIDQEIVALEKEKPEIPRAMAVEEGKPTDLKVHLRGSYLTLGENSPRRFPSAVSDPNQPTMPSTESGRLQLAKWMTDAKNPLTARVFVNRVWRWKFGRGIVASVDNFGALGELPSHPELLDWLATSFVKEDGWSLKKLQKRLMLTNTYLMSGQYDAKAAELDPDNRLLWRFPRKRLEAEAIRDSIWFVAGKLDRSMGGSMMTFAPRSYVTSTESSNPLKYDSPRRSVYLPVIRAAVYDVYTAFDFGDPSVMNGDRASTTIAPQALFMLNSQVVLSASKVQAESLLKHSELDDAARVRQLFLTCYGRPASPAEVTRSLDFLGRFQVAYAATKDPRMNAWQSLCKSIVAANEFIYVE